MFLQELCDLFIITNSVILHATNVGQIGGEREREYSVTDMSEGYMEGGG